MKRNEFHAASAMFELAERRASRRAPKPAIEPIQAGIGGMFATGIIVLIFSSVAGLDIETGNMGIAMFVAVAVGGGAPYWFFESQNRAHLRESSKEINKLIDLSEEDLRWEYDREFERYSS